VSQPPLEPLRKFRDVAEGVRARETGDGRNHAVQSGRQGIKRAASAAVRTPLSADVRCQKEIPLRRLRFWSPRDFHVQAGFSPDTYLGLQILDVSRRQLEDISIEVSCFENTPGFSFYARSVEEMPVQGIV
jgi:hypothetical protein